MFTVCPKCALTLVVTAADLRVAQGYVRCGRCSNVFNALARLSEDRAAAPNTSQAPAQASPQAPAQAPAPPPAPTPPPKPDASGTFRTKATPDANGTKPRPVDGTFRTRAVPDTSASAKPRQPTSPAAPPPSEPKRYDDNSIAEEDLEFNPDSTDLNKVFVEQSPSPQFTAATGTFKTLKLEAESTARTGEELTRTDEREQPAHDTFDPVDTQVDVEIDPDLLATMAQLTSNRLERLNPTPPIEEPEQERPRHEAPAPTPPTAAGSASRSGAAAKPAAPPKPTLLLQPPLEQPPQPPAPMRLAERAKARADAARTGADAPEPSLKPEPPRQSSKAKSEGMRATALETSQALKEALAPRKRRSAYDSSSSDAEQPTSFYAGTWTAGSIVLALVLLVQIVHHYRNDLAANATLNGPLTALYASLGIPIVPRWDLTAYEVRQLGASTAADAPGQITVRASVKNGAHQAQPLPLLRVTLQDRFGNRIASRDVPPQSYLPRAIPRSALLSAGQRVDAEMAFVDPGANAVGFEIDACLPAPGGGISCASDVAR